MGAAQLHRPLIARFKVLRFVALLALLALVAAGCSGTDGDTDEGAEAPEPTEAGTGEAEEPAEDPGDDATEPSGEQVELLVWFLRDYYIPPDGFASFHAEYPNITVETDVIEGGDVLPSLLRMRDAGEKLPDVIHLSEENRAALYEAGLVTGIEDVVAQWEEEDPELYNLLYPVVWGEAAQAADGTLIGMADTSDMDQILYRSDWFEELGLDPCCESWDQILDDLRAIKESGLADHPWTMMGTRGQGVNYLFGHMVAAGVEFEGATPQLDSEAGHYVINWYQTLAREELISPETIAWGESEFRGAFLSERAGMVIEGAHFVGQAEEAGLQHDENWLLVNMPTSRTGASEDGGRLAVGRAFHITPDAPKYEASLVLRYVAETENALAVNLQGGSVPRQREVLESPEFRENLPAWSDQTVAEFTEVTALPPASNQGEVTEVLERLQQDLIQNPDVPAEEMAEKWMAELNAL